MECRHLLSLMGYFYVYLFPLFSLLHRCQMSSEDSEWPSTEGLDCISHLVHAALVSKSCATSDQSNCASSGESTTVPSVGNCSNITSTSRQASPSYSHNLSQLPETAALPLDIGHIIGHRIRKTTRKNYKVVHNSWIQFTSEKSFNPYRPSVKNVLVFLHSWHQMKVSPNTLFMYKTALKRIVHTSFHFILDNVLISQYLSGLFNLFLRPPKPQRDVWDVNQVLLYWDCQPFNKDLPLMMLLQKNSYVDSHFNNA